jgi:hypothetical protein
MSGEMYILEVVKFSRESGYEHIGYMDARGFRTKNAACDYYDKHNPHMRKINEHNTYASDWDSNTKLRYIVRKDFAINCTIPPFTLKGDE